MAEETGPSLTGVNHFSATVTDIEASVAWYQRLFGMIRVPVTFPHYDCEDTGYAVLLLEPRSGVAQAQDHGAGDEGAEGPQG